MSASPASTAERFSIPLPLDGEHPTIGAALRADIRLYFDVPFDEIVDDFLPVFDELWTWCGRPRFAWWKNEGMPIWERMRPRTPFTLHSALGRGLPRNLGLFTAKGVESAEGENARFQVADTAISARWYTRGGTFAGEGAGELRALDRWQRMTDDPSEWRGRVLALCDALPVKSGVAGFVAEQEGLPRVEMARLYGVAMRHPGVDLDNDWTLSMAAPHAIKGVSWLTVLGRAAADLLGGVEALRAALPAPIAVHETKHAIVVEAGPAPRVGDVNRGDRLDEYRAVYAVVRDLHQPMVEAAIPFQMGRPDDPQRTEAWLRRFDPGSP